MKLNYVLRMHKCEGQSDNPNSVEHQIIELRKTSEFCPSQWSFLTEDNRIGYVRYRWGVLSVQVTVPFEMIIKYTSIPKIISEMCTYCKIFRGRFPIFKYIGLVIKHIWKYKIFRKKYSDLRTLDDIPEMFEYEACSNGMYILYKELDNEGLDGVIEWSEVLNQLNFIDFFEEIKKISNGDEEKFYKTMQKQN